MSVDNCVVCLGLKGGLTIGKCQPRLGHGLCAHLKKPGHPHLQTNINGLLYIYRSPRCRFPADTGLGIWHQTPTSRDAAAQIQQPDLQESSSAQQRIEKNLAFPALPVDMNYSRDQLNDLQQGGCLIRDSRPLPSNTACSPATPRRPTQIAELRPSILVIIVISSAQHSQLESWNRGDR